MKITNNTIEFNDREKQFLALWRERFGRLPPDWSSDDILDPAGSSTWHQVVRLLDRPISMELLTKILDECADAKKPPTVYWLRKEYERRGGSAPRTSADCYKCHNLGVLHIACEPTRDGTAAIISDDPIPCQAFVNTIPCTCERGTRHNRNGDASQLYSMQTLERLAKHTFSDPLDADRFACTCQSLYRKKHHQGAATC